MTFRLAWLPGTYPSVRGWIGAENDRHRWVVWFGRFEIYWWKQ